MSEIQAMKFVKYLTAWPNQEDFTTRPSRKHDGDFSNRVAYRKLIIHYGVNLLVRGFQQKLRRTELN